MCFAQDLLHFFLFGYFVSIIFLYFYIHLELCCGMLSWKSVFSVKTKNLYDSDFAFQMF